MIARTVRTLFAASIAAACSSNEPKVQTFNLCVHPSGTVFVPGSTGTSCSGTQTVQKGETTTLLIDADMYSGSARSATISVPFGAPTGWTVTLGGTNIDVPGQQTLAITVPANAASGDYPLLVRAVSGGEQIDLLFDVRLTGGNPF